MKKIILFLALITSALFSFGQNIVMMNNVAATATGYYPANYIVGKVGFLQITTSSTWNATTATDTLQVSNDNINWSDALDCNGNIIQWTLSYPSSTLHSYSVTFISTGGKFYRNKYNAGNGTTGTIK